MKICITGGIGSGKSRVGEVLSSLGYFVLSADEVNGKMLECKRYQKKVGKIFPEAFGEGGLDKATVRRIILDDEPRRLALNELAHGEIMSRMFSLAEGKDVAFFEVPLLDKSYAKEFDRIWYVTAPRSIRAERIVKRDGVSIEEAEKMISLQEGNGGIIELATDIIHNGGEDLSVEVARLLEDLVKR